MNLVSAQFPHHALPGEASADGDVARHAELIARAVVADSSTTAPADLLLTLPDLAEASSGGDADAVGTPMTTLALARAAMSSVDRAVLLHPLGEGGRDLLRGALFQCLVAYNLL